MATVNHSGNVITITDLQADCVVRLPFGIVDGFVNGTNPIYFGESEAANNVGDFPVPNCNGYPSTFFMKRSLTGNSMITIILKEISPAANPNYGEDFAKLYPVTVEEKS